MPKDNFPHKFPEVTVTWADHWSDYGQGFSIEDVEEKLRDYCIRKTKGWLIGQNKRQIAVAGTIEEDGTVSEFFVCMKKAIIKLEYN